MTANPWIDRHMEVERRFADGPAELAHAERAVAGEYAGTDDMARTCRCGAQAHYRATVGAVQCPRCRSLWDSEREEWF